MYNSPLRLARFLVVFALIVTFAVMVSPPQEVMAQSPFTPPTHVSVTMYQLTASGERVNPPILCTAGSLEWGCTAHCQDPFITHCTNGPFIQYAFGGANPVVVEIDGTAGNPFFPYNQYLRDIVPLEIGIHLVSREDGTMALSSVEAQAIATRTYTYNRIAYEEQYGPINNSNQFHVFVPYYFDRLALVHKRQVAAATTLRRYMTEAASTWPIDALYGADNGDPTVTGNRPYLKSVPDPISAAYGIVDGTANGGMSSKGASRWGFGHTSSRGAVDFGNSQFPHDIAGNGDFWSVRYDRSAQILTHYYTGIHLRDANAPTLLVSPPWRWVPLSITWGENCSFYTTSTWQTCTVTLVVQNVGTDAWYCTRPLDTSKVILGYRWVNGITDQKHDGVSTSDLCLNGPNGFIPPGGTLPATLQINDWPVWHAGPHILRIDAAIQFADPGTARMMGASNARAWFSEQENNPWYSFDFPVCVIGSCVFAPMVETTGLGPPDVVPAH